MSLFDALLLESYRLNVWIAIRSDGIKGSGTLSDPYDGSTAAKFDALMRDIAAQTTATVGVRGLTRPTNVVPAPTELKAAA